MREDTAGTVRRDVYQAITDKIILGIYRGLPTYEMPWHRGIIVGGRPVNAFTECAYRGVNAVVLWAAAETGSYQSRYWATYRQWRMLQAQVREGERGSPIVFYQEAQRERLDEATGEVSADPYLVARSSWVFNSDQVEGWTAPAVAARSQVEPVQAAEALVASTGAEIRHGGERACYIPSRDIIQMPDRERFRATAAGSATEGYFSVLLHELTHWTSHESRLNRELGKRFGDEAYAMEELVAELGAAFLCADLGVSNTPRPDHAAYIADWLAVLKRDSKALFTAAARAATAAEYLFKSQRSNHGNPPTTGASQ